MARPKDIGTAGETAVVRFLRPWWPDVERRALSGSQDRGDVAGTPGICWQIKAGAYAKTASDGQVLAWLDETEAQRMNAGARYSVLVLARAGYGAQRVGHWWAIFPAYQLGISLGDAYRGAPIRMHLATCVDWFAGRGVLGIPGAL